MNTSRIPALSESNAAIRETLLPGPFSRPVGPELEVRPEVTSLVKTQVDALLSSAPAYSEMNEFDRNKLASNLTKVAAYTASLIQMDWQDSLDVGLTPLVREQTTVEGERTQAVPGAAASSQSAPAQAFADQPPPADEFATRATGDVARITEDTLNAIAFPTFVADLVRGTFQAVVDASIQQMEAYGELLANVAKTVEEFMADNITDNQARDYLANRYPQAMQLDTTQGAPVLRPTDNADTANAAGIQRDLGLPDEPSMDEDTMETVLVPAARRQLAQSRQQVLATMVLMGINRIVVTSGRIQAAMGFRIDATDRGRAESASQFDFANETNMRYGWFLSPVKVESKTTVAYVSSSKKDSESEIDVSADLTGEVDLRFKSQTFPLERFADAGVISSIQDNTVNPAANKPITGDTASE